MFKNAWFMVFCAAVAILGHGAVCATDRPAEKTAQMLHVDIPLKLSHANVVLNIDRVALNGDMPVAIGHLNLLVNDFSESNTQGHIVAIFHTDVGHVTLDDKAYNAARHVETGNPYKKLVVALMKRGVQIELCGATATANKWVNADLLPGVQVNVDAMGRLAQLVQEGYVQIKE